MPISARVGDCLTMTAAIFAALGLCMEWCFALSGYDLCTMGRGGAGFNFDPSECIPRVLSFADVS